MDPALELYRKDLVVESGRKLDKARMIRFDERTGYFASTDLGRTASHFYIKYNTIEVNAAHAHMFTLFTAEVHGASHTHTHTHTQTHTHSSAVGLDTLVLGGCVRPCIYAQLALISIKLHPAGSVDESVTYR